MIVAFEGLDGAGKETQSRLLADSLNREGCNVYLYHFPAYRGPFHEIYQKITGMDIPMQGKNRLIQHLFAEDMKRALESHRGEIIILDRYMYSTFAYGKALGVHSRDLSAYTADLPPADVVIYLRLDPSDARVTGHFAEEIQRRACVAYDGWARKNTNWVIMDATDSLEDIRTQCIEAAKAKLY